MYRADWNLSHWQIGCNDAKRNAPRKTNYSFDHGYSNGYKFGRQLFANRFIAEVAIKHTDGHVYSMSEPNRHHNIIALIAEIGGEDVPGVEAVQGFVDNLGNFLTRCEAFEVAVTAKQYKRHEQLNGYSGVKLFSEDLW